MCDNFRIEHNLKQWNNITQGKEPLMGSLNSSPNYLHDPQTKTSQDFLLSLWLGREVSCRELSQSWVSLQPFSFLFQPWLSSGWSCFRSKLHVAQLPQDSESSTVRWQGGNQSGCSFQGYQLIDLFNGGNCCSFKSGFLFHKLNLKCWGFEAGFLSSEREG